MFPLTGSGVPVHKETAVSLLRVLLVGSLAMLMLVMSRAEAAAEH
jgi:hypothetical protein